MSATLALAGILTGCGSGVLQRAGLPPSVVQNNDRFFISDAQERAIGRRAHPQLVSSYGGVYENARVDELVSQIVERLRQTPESEGRRYRVTILNSPSVNAFALPGGYLYVTRGMVALANNEDELAAVLAHEMAHVIARHAIRRQQAIEATLSSAAQSAPSLGPPSTQPAEGARSYLARFSRQQELEADTIGLKIAASAGYDPLAAATVLTNMTRQSGLRAQRFFADFNPNSSDFLSSHPAPPERMAAILSEARTLGYNSVTETPAARASYIQRISGMLYGDDSIEGFVRGRTYTHPGLALTFTVPDGFRIDNRPDAVNAIASDGSVLRFDGEPIRQDQTLRDYLQAVWSDGVNVTNVQDLTINGLRALSAKATSSGWTFELFVFRWTEDRVFRMLFATKNSTSAQSASFEQSANSVRRLSDSERQQAAPLRLAAYQVQQGDTMQKLAQTVPQEDNKVERFRVLNGLESANSLRPGMFVKVVSNR